jgi:hypothetical protein
MGLMLRGGSFIGDCVGWLRTARAGIRRCGFRVIADAENGIDEIRGEERR